MDDYQSSRNVASNGRDREKTKDDSVAEKRHPKLRTILDISWEARVEHNNDRARYKPDFRE